MSYKLECILFVFLYFDMCMFNVIRQVIALFERERNDRMRFIQVESKVLRKLNVRFANKSKMVISIEEGDVSWVPALYVLYFFIQMI